MQVDEKTLEDIIQSIIDSPTITAEEKKNIFSKVENIKEMVEKIIKEKDTEVIEVFNKKIIKKFYKNPDSLSKINFSDPDWISNTMKESFIINGDEMYFLIGIKPKINNRLRELYEISCEGDFDREVEKSKKMIALLKKYKGFFVNTKEKEKIYEKILQILQILISGSFINFKELKERVENL